MKPNPVFTNQNNEFWACVKLISQKLGYSQSGSIIIPQEKYVRLLFKSLKLSEDKIFANGGLTDFGKTLFAYFEYRSDVLTKQVQSNLMNVTEAKALYEGMIKNYVPKCPTPMNKQSGTKKAVAFFTAIINILIEQNIKGLSCIYDPRQITAFTDNNFPARSLSRRVDGSFPDEINPVAIWEIKEYYYTTTFGSRIADGVYESMLDGYELIDVRNIIKRPVFHYLMIDAKTTWWDMGKPYLCRIVDMMHMGLVTECLFGKEVVARIPQLVPEWLEVQKKMTPPKDDQLKLTISP